MFCINIIADIHRNSVRFQTIKMRSSNTVHIGTHKSDYSDIRFSTNRLLPDRSAIFLTVVKSFA